MVVASKQIVLLGWLLSYKATEQAESTHKLESIYWWNIRVLAIVQKIIWGSLLIKKNMS